MKIVHELMVSGTDRAVDLMLWKIPHHKNSLELTYELEISLSDSVSVTFRTKEQVNHLIKFLNDNKIFLK